MNERVDAIVADEDEDDEAVQVEEVDALSAGGVPGRSHVPVKQTSSGRGGRKDSCLDAASFASSISGAWSDFCNLASGDVGISTAGFKENLVLE
jgi:hypothetical protein